MAYSAAEPVSPEVAPNIFNVLFFLCKRYSKIFPRNCIAISLKANVGPLDNERRYK